VPKELASEDKQHLVELIASQFGIPETTAEACLIAGGWDPGAAARIAGLNRVDYLLLNLRFTGKNPLPHGGLVSILLKRGSDKPVYIVGLTLDGYEYIEDVSPHLPAADFIKAITQPAKLQRDNSLWLTLRQSLTFNMNADAVDALFQIGREKVSEVDEYGKISEHDSLKQAVIELVKHAIDDLFMESVKLDVAIDALNGFQYDNLKELFQDEPPDTEEETEEGKKPSKPFETFKVYMKGQFIIDPHAGVPVEELNVGDTIICDIIDDSPVACEVGKMLGVYRRGVWFPAKAKIVSIEDTLSGSQKITMRAGHGIYIIAVALNAVRIKVSESELDSIQRRIDYQRDETVRSTLSLLPLALVILGIALALTILLQRG
jgi:hypothetical protein